MTLKSIKVLKITAVLLLIVLELCACGSPKTVGGTAKNPVGVTGSAQKIMRGAWISYIELSNHDKTEAGFKANVCKMFDKFDYFELFRTCAICIYSTFRLLHNHW